MSKEWYNINVKEEILKKVKEYFIENNLNLSLFESIKDKPLKNLIDYPILEDKVESEKISDYIRKQYYTIRAIKYGNKDFWDSAVLERNIGYKNQWNDFIIKLLLDYCIENSDVLFVGTANGAEIPNSSLFNFYALEEIESSVQNIDKTKVVSAFQGDFENSNLIINNGKGMDAIVALRCLMPNTRLEFFLNFAKNNIKSDGVLILSHPLSYFDNQNEFQKLPNCEQKRIDFEKRLQKALNTANLFELIKHFGTVVEYFYILKLRNKK